MVKLNKRELKKILWDFMPVHSVYIELNAGDKKAAWKDLNELVDLIDENKERIFCYGRKTTIRKV